MLTKQYYIPYYVYIPKKFFYIAQMSIDIRYQQRKEKTFEQDNIYKILGNKQFIYINIIV